MAAQSTAISNGRFGQWSGCRTARASSHRNGSARSSRQKPTATGPTSDILTSQGPKASATFPNRSAGKASGW